MGPVAAEQRFGARPPRITPQRVEPVNESVFLFRHPGRASALLHPTMRKKNTSRKPHRKTAGRRVNPLTLATINPNTAGADIGAREISVCVPSDRDEQNVRTFLTFTDSLQELVRWLQDCRITSLAMESTGNYWLPLHQLLAPSGIEVVLVNARHVRGVPGRKSDVLDCQWLQLLHSVGLLRGSFRPPQDICALRSLTRVREGILRSAGEQMQLIQNACDQMNLHLHHVLSDISGVSGLKIIEAIVAGERDPVTLAQMRDRRCKATVAEVRRSLQGDWRPEHLLALELAWQTWGHLRSQIEKLDAEIASRVEALEAKVDLTQTAVPPKRKGIDNSSNGPKQGEHLRAEFFRVLGVDLTAVPALSVLTVQGFISEIGSDLRSFRSAAHFISYLGLCPGTRISGGKVLDSRTRKGKPRFALLLRQACLSLHRSKSALGARYHRLRSKLGAPKALTAMAHVLARVIYAMVTTGSEYDETRFAKLEQRHQERRKIRLAAQAKEFGFQLVPLAA